jgi:hypothetical protein
VAGAEAGMASRCVARSLGFILIGSRKGMALAVPHAEYVGLKGLRENSTRPFSAYANALR